LSIFLYIFYSLTYIFLFTSSGQIAIVFPRLPVSAVEKDSLPTVTAQNDVIEATR